jgi:hypothetical protein
MMYVLVNNGQLLLGPMNWNFRMFESALRDDLEITQQLPPTKTDASVIDIGNGITIRPVEMLADPAYNPKIQGLHGPFFDYSDPTKAVGHYEVMDYSIEAIQNFLISQVADLRYKQEVSGAKVILQGQEVLLTTARGERDIFLQAMLLGSNGASWKFPKGIYLTLSNDELKTIVQEIMVQVQDAFTWEHTKTTEILSKTTAADLDAVVLEYGQ